MTVILGEGRIHIRNIEIVAVCDGVGGETSVLDPLDDLADAHATTLEPGLAVEDIIVAYDVRCPLCHIVQH